MKITEAASKKEIGGGWILYGNNPDWKPGCDKPKKKWFERWYPTRAKAIRFCKKRNWFFELTNK